MDVDGMAVAEIIKSPDLVEQLVAREDAVRAGREMEQKLHFLGRRLDALAVDDELERVKVDNELVEDQTAGLGLLVLAARAAQNGLDTAKSSFISKGI